MGRGQERGCGVGEGTKLIHLRNSLIAVWPLPPLPPKVVLSDVIALGAGFQHVHGGGELFTNENP